jgi:hypothetical protein
MTSLQPPRFWTADGTRTDRVDGIGRFDDGDVLAGIALALVHPSPR